ncbi:unnamed protein product [Boreogadus saida]
MVKPGTNPHTAPAYQRDLRRSKNTTESHRGAHSYGDVFSPNGPARTDPSLQKDMRTKVAKSGTETPPFIASVRSADSPREFRGGHNRPLRQDPGKEFAGRVICREPNPADTRGAHAGEVPTPVEQPSAG